MCPPTKSVESRQYIIYKEEEGSGGDENLHVNEGWDLTGEVMVVPQA